MYARFEKLLNEKNVTVYQVSKVTGIDQGTLSHWKKGDYTPKVDKLMKLAEYFGVPVTYFLK